MTNPSSPTKQPGFIPLHGGYRLLKSFQMSGLVYDATVMFCDRFIDPRSLTYDRAMNKPWLKVLIK